MSSFKLASPILWQSAAVFLARVYGVPFGPAQQVTVAEFGFLDGLLDSHGPQRYGIAAFDDMRFDYSSRRWKRVHRNFRPGLYRPTAGRLSYKGRDITRLGANARAGLGIGRTFQNLALFGHMTVLDNILVGRHHLLGNNFLTGGIYWLTGAQQE